MKLKNNPFFKKLNIVIVPNFPLKIIEIIPNTPASNSLMKYIIIINARVDKLRNELCFPYPILFN